MQNLRRFVPQALMYSSRPKARTAHIAPVRLAPENLLFSGLRNLMRGVAQDLEYSSTRRPCAPCASEPAFDGMQNLVRCVLQRLTYSSRPKARTAHIASGRLADENLLFSGLRNLMRGVARV